MSELTDHLWIEQGGGFGGGNPSDYSDGIRCHKTYCCAACKATLLEPIAQCTTCKHIKAAEAKQQQQRE